jgi:hypothetical protein
MGRYRKGQCFAFANETRYIVQRDQLNQLLEFEVLPPRADLRTAMTAAVGRLTADGWIAETDFDHGCVFLRRGGERRLLAITARHPASTSLQSFSPFGPNEPP